MTGWSFWWIWKVAKDNGVWFIFRAKSPKALETFNFPLIRPFLRNPPVRWIRSFSSSFSGLWSIVSQKTFPSRARKDFVSPQFTMIISEDVWKFFLIHLNEINFQRQKNGAKVDWSIYWNLLRWQHSRCFPRWYSLSTFFDPTGRKFVSDRIRFLSLSLIDFEKFSGMTTFQQLLVWDFLSRKAMLMLLHAHLLLQTSNSWGKFLQL